MIAIAKPSFIVEIGVHQGIRAAMMVSEALKHNSEVLYVGYDVFDTKDTAFHEAAFNGKGIVGDADARANLREVKGSFTYQFVIGDTRETLHDTSVIADFVFIDGDHRVEVIQADYEAVKDSRVIVFDDYYTGGPDTEIVGCNKVVEQLNFTLVPQRDPVRGGGFTQLAVVQK